MLHNGCQVSITKSKETDVVRQEQQFLCIFEYIHLHIHSVIHIRPWGICIWPKPKLPVTTSAEVESRPRPYFGRHLAPKPKPNFGRSLQWALCILLCAHSLHWFYCTHVIIEEINMMMMMITLLVLVLPTRTTAMTLYNHNPNPNRKSYHITLWYDTTWPHAKTVINSRLNLLHDNYTKNKQLTWLPSPRSKAQALACLPVRGAPWWVLLEHFITWLFSSSSVVSRAFSARCV